MRILIANWKCQGEVQNLSDLYAWVSSIQKPSLSLVVLLPAPFLALWKNYNWPDWVFLGAQCTYPDKGAYTGAFHAGMLREIGCEYVCVGHSERRSHFGEKDIDCFRQYQAILEADMQPILCVGEPKGDMMEAGERLVWLKNQLTSVLTGEGFDNLKKHDIIIAYEPGWAIGTGQAATIHDITHVVIELKKWLASLITTKNPMFWCYGGSVNSSNMASFAQVHALDGLLIGKASFDQQVIHGLLT